MNWLVVSIVEVYVVLVVTAIVLDLNEAGGEVGVSCSVLVFVDTRLIVDVNITVVGEG